MRAGSINSQNFMSADVCASVFQGWNNNFGRVVRHDHPNKHTDWPLVGETHLFQSFIISIGFSAIFTVSYALFGSSRKASRAFFVLPLRTTLRPPNFIFNFHKQWRKNESGEEQIDVSESSAHCSTTMAGVSYNKLARLTEQHESEMGIFPS